MQAFPRGAWERGASGFRLRDAERPSWTFMQKRPAGFEEVRGAGACRSNLVTTLCVVTHRWTLRVLVSGIDATRCATEDSASATQTAPAERSHAEHGDE